MPRRVIAGRTALVTGGARGIGRATAEALLREGVTVAIADVDADLAAETASALGIASYALDVRDLDQFVDVVARVEAEVAPLDVLVNNAGIMPIAPFLELDPVLDDRQIDINIRGVLHGMRAAMPGMLKRGRGHIVNIASTAGMVGVPYVGVYSGTKHAVRGITEAVRHEYPSLDFSYVMPAIVRTDLTSGTKSLRWPPKIEATDVADAVVGCLISGQVDVFVPRFARLTAVLPALLPRRVTEAVGRVFGIDRVFEQVDPVARQAYQQRITS